MRRESHRRRGVYRASTGGWGHRAVYVGAVVATAAIIAGFGAAVLVYGPIGTPFRQLSGSTLGSPPVGVSFGNAVEVLASGLPAYNATPAGENHFDVNGYSNASSVCTASGVWTPSAGSTYFNATSGNVTSGNVTYVCLNSVGSVFGLGPFGFLNSTWNANLTNYWLTDMQGYTAIPNGSAYVNPALGQNVTSCNSFTAPVGAGPYFSPWNVTHIYNSTFAPCNTYYEMNNNTSVVLSFDGVPGNSTLWVTNQTGYQADDVVYEVPVVFNNTTVTNGNYSISIAIAGVTPVAQTFILNVTAGGGTNGAGTVVFVFDMTAAWLFDASYSYNGTGAVPSSSIAPEIYGAIGLVSTIVSECTSNNVCP